MKNMPLRMNGKIMEKQLKCSVKTQGHKWETDAKDAFGRVNHCPHKRE